ncbi:MAG TPA: TlpA family protein disulfide reductase [Nitrososphaeraceae archaeon]|nr:TlpA family protein disulfide reductase [Nitrososphaeraceae archaeon]
MKGPATNIQKEKGNVIFVEIFQVNCPGCFLYGIPEAIRLFDKYNGRNVVVLGLATAFEDYDKNNLENLRLLLASRKVIGETYRILAQLGQLVEGNKLPYNIPFSVGMDLIVNEQNNVNQLTESKITRFIEDNLGNFESYPQRDKEILISQARHYLENKKYTALTFEEYGLRGTPSSIIIDKKGILRFVDFGSDDLAEEKIIGLLKE